MKKHIEHESLLEKFSIQIISAIVMLVLTTAISFAWTTNTRLTRLETALVNLSSDVHDIKLMLEKKGR